MTRFFVPGASPGGPAERAYAELRGHVEARTGRLTRTARIYAVNCRRDGADRETRVGECDPCGGGTVDAIFATSEGCTIIWRGGYADVGKRQTYEVIEFD